MGDSIHVVLSDQRRMMKKSDAVWKGAVQCPRSCQRISGTGIGLRATDPRLFIPATDSQGPDNNRHLDDALAVSDLVIAAWGTRAPAARVAHFLSSTHPRQLHCLGTNVDGSPGHPLYVSAKARLQYRP